MMKYTLHPPDVLIMQTIVHTTGMVQGTLNYPDHLESWVHHYSFYLNLSLILILP